jgi:hypothetical protein
MADLFITVTDPTTLKTSYEIYLRREIQSSDEEQESDFYSFISSQNKSVSIFKTYLIVHQICLDDYTTERTKFLLFSIER